MQIDYAEFKMKELAYSTIITENELGSIIEVFVPDLEMVFIPDKHSLLSLNSVRKKIQLYIDELSTNNEAIPIPKKISSYRHISLEENQYFTKLYIFVDYKKGCFEKGLPYFGIIVTIGSVLCASIGVALSVLTSSNESLGIALAVMGAVFSLIIQLVDYIFSTSSKFYADLGRSVDDFCKNKSHITSDAISCCRQAAMIYLMYLAIGTVIIGDVGLSGAFSPYKTSRALIEKAVEAGYLWLGGAFKDIYPVLAAIFNGSASFSFHIGFASLAAQKWNALITECFFSGEKNYSDIKNNKSTFFNYPSQSEKKSLIIKNALITNYGNSTNITMGDKLSDTKRDILFIQ